MLTSTEIEKFHHQGFLIFSALINGERLARYQALFDGIVDRSRTLNANTEHYTLEKEENGQVIPGFLHKVQGVCAAEPGVDLCQFCE